MAERLDEQQVDALDDLLGQVHDAGNSRFGEVFVARTLSFPPAQARDALLEAVQCGVLTFVYEVLCPDCGSAVGEIGSLADIPREPVQCTDFDCGSTFTPTAENVVVYYRIVETPRPKVLAPRWMSVVLS